MVVDRATRSITHRLFCDILELIPANDLLVVNTTRVFRARLLGTRDSGAAAEILLLKPLGKDRWEAMVHPGIMWSPGVVASAAMGTRPMSAVPLASRAAHSEGDIWSI